jgi:hypothetical protein
MPVGSYSDNVFVNCPFDAQYKPLFDATVFAVFDCGYIARCALEIDDASQVRIDKIGVVIGECRYGIHDISRTELDPTHQLPRFNMPLELGMFLGAKRYGSGQQDEKVCLIMDVEPYRYQKFLSDVAGQDIRSHGNDIEKLIVIVRNWLRSSSKRTTVPGGKAIYSRYMRFRGDLPEICAKFQLSEDELTFNDFTHVVSEWLKENG